jgi:hypothetical protein
MVKHAKIDIDALSVIESKLPAREWAALHQEELHNGFESAANMQPPRKIEPLA